MEPDMNIWIDLATRAPFIFIVLFGMWFYVTKVYPDSKDRADQQLVAEREYRDGWLATARAHTEELQLMKKQMIQLQHYMDVILTVMSDGKPQIIEMVRDQIKRMESAS